MPDHIVRQGQTSDIPWILKELKEFSEFYGTTRRLYPGDESATRQLELVIEQHVLLVSLRGDIGTGLMAGLLSPHFMNPNIITLTEVLWWVPKEYRGTRAGYVLLKEFTDIGTKVADFVIMTTECKSPVSDKMLERFGYRQYEKSFLLEV